MIEMHGWEWALLAAAVLVILEMLTGAYVALSLAIGCLGVAAAEFALNGASLVRDAIVFALAAGLAAGALRALFGRPNDSKRVRGDVNDY